MILERNTPETKLYPEIVFPLGFTRPPMMLSIIIAHDEIHYDVAFR